MLKVKNQKVIRKISARSLMANKKKNLIAVLAIMLTCILFTAVFSIGGSMIKSSQESTFRQVGGSHMAGLKYALPEDFEKLSKDPAVKDICMAVIVGRGVNDQLSKVNTEVNYADDTYARFSFCYPEEGTMPKEKTDIAASTLVLDALGVPRKIGAKVPLEIDIDGRLVKEEFTLCGFWEGDPVAMAQECWISKEMADELAPTPQVPYAESSSWSFNGYMNIDWNFSSSWDIEGQLIEVLERNGYDPEVTDYGVNWGYAASEVDWQTVALIGVILFIILLSGYLIIYNVFYINVTGEIHEYGLLKTIGTTAKQLKKLVYRQAMLLSVAGIPLGLLLGTLLSKILLPIVTKNFIFRSVTFSMNPLIYAAAVIFTFLTVFLSCNKPCRLAAKVSPIEAVRYTEKSSVKKKTKKSRKVSAFSMAVENIKRSRKKVVVVVMSLSMSLILVNLVYSIVHSFDMEAYISNSIIGDIQVTHSSVLNPGASVKIYDGVSQEEYSMFEELDGVESSFQVYTTGGYAILKQEGKQKVQDFIDRHETLKNDPWMADAIEAFQREGIMDADIYGVDKGAFDKLEFRGKSITWEEFTRGDYLLLAEENQDEADWILNAGEKICLEFHDGTKKEYTAITVANLPYPLSTRAYPALGVRVILPAEEYLSHTERCGALVTTLEVEEDKQASVEEFLKAYTENGNSELTYVSRQTYIDEFESFVSMFWIVGGSLSFILALIGILNFINAIVTSILTRKQEFAMMEAVGMTRKQLRIMLIFEGMLYACLTLLFSLTIGSLVCGILVNAASGMVWFFKYYFNIVPILLCAPVLLIFSCIIPFGAYGQMSRDSIVERLKIIE